MHGHFISSAVATHSDAISRGGLICRVRGVDGAIPAEFDAESSTVKCPAPAEMPPGQDACKSSRCAVYSLENELLLSDEESEVITAEPIGPQKSGSSVWLALSFVDRFLAVWIILAMVVGVLLGYYCPSVKAAFESVTLDTVSLPVAIGLWLMMWPVLSKVKYEVLGQFFKRREGWNQMAWSIGINWIVGPALMTALAWATLPDVSSYRNGVIIVGIARCIAMVMLWNQLSQGDPEYCALMVAVNSILQMVLFAPLAVFYLQVVSRQYLDDSSVSFGFWPVCRSVLIYLGAPLVAGVITRYGLIAACGEGWYEKRFLPYFSPIAFLSLIYTIVVLFTLQGHEVIAKIGQVCRIIVPMTLYFAVMWISTLMFFRRLGYGYKITIAQAFTSSSNNFELAIAIAAGTFGANSPEALAATIGPLIEVPVLLSLVYVALWLKDRLPWKDIPKQTATDHQTASGGINREIK